jgi:hypothetical protein
VAAVSVLATILSVLLILGVASFALFAMMCVGLLVTVLFDLDGVEELRRRSESLGE